MLEKDITKLILNELKEYGCFCWKHWSGPMSKKGVADILGCLPGGRALAIEVKRPGAKPTTDQISFLKDISTTGGLGFVADNVDVVQRELRQVGIERKQQRLF